MLYDNLRRNYRTIPQKINELSDDTKEFLDKFRPFTDYLQHYINDQRADDLADFILMIAPKLDGNKMIIRTNKILIDILQVYEPDLYRTLEISKDTDKDASKDEFKDLDESLDITLNFLSAN